MEYKKMWHTLKLTKTEKSRTMGKELLKKGRKERQSHVTEAYPKAKKSREENVELQFIVPWAMNHDKAEKQKKKQNIKSSESIAFF